MLHVSDNHVRRQPQTSRTVTPDGPTFGGRSVALIQRDDTPWVIELMSSGSSIREFSLEVPGSENCGRQDDTALDTTVQFARFDSDGNGSLDAPYHYALSTPHLAA